MKEIVIFCMYLLMHLRKIILNILISKKQEGSNML